jgi:hypothetical protein
MGVNFYTLFAILLAFTFLTTLRFSLTGTLKTSNPVLRFATHPAWLYTLILAGGYVLGAYYHGAMEPWPPAAFAAANEKAGLWAGLAAGFGTATVDIWLFWATATAFKTFSPPHERRVIPIYYIVNMGVGLYLMVRFYPLAPVGAPLLTG